MRIKEVSKMTGLTERTIRYYESCGLVIPDMEMKDHRVWRDYSEEHARLLSAVGTLRRASFRVEEIALLLSAPEKIPETVKRVRERVEATRAEAEKLCERLGQPDLAEAADIVDLARQLEKTTSGFELPPSDRNYRTRGMDRYYREPRSLSASLAVRIGALVCILWLLSMGLVTCVTAKDLGRQAAVECEDALNTFFEDPETAASLTEQSFRPGNGILTRSGLEFELMKATLVLNERGIVTENEGFQVELSAANADTELGLAVMEGRLCLMFAANPGIGNTRSAKSSRSYLTFRDATQFGVSFPCQEIAGDYPDEAKQYVVGIPIQEGTLHEGAIPSSGIFSAPEMEFHPPLELLDGIESGTLHFDADGVLQGSRLRGAWLRDGKGEKACFLLAAYGWSPLAMAFRLLPGTYLVGLALFLLLGFLLWLALRRSLVRPLKAWDAALGDTLLAVNPEEFDYSCRYQELRDLAALYLLRRQMQEASSQKPSTEEVDPVSAMDVAQRKLLPLIDARRMDPATDYRTEGIVAASPKALEDALLALIQEALPYGEQDEKLTLRVLERESFILAEVEVRTKVLRVGAYEALWDGVYRLPGSADAPGARLRKATAAIPGSFVAVRKTRRGLCLTLGLPGYPGKN